MRALLLFSWTNTGIHLNYRWLTCTSNLVYQNIFLKCEDILGIFQMKSYICRVYAVIHETQYMRLIG